MCKPVFGFVAWCAGAEMSASSCIKLWRVEFCRVVPAGGKYEREKSVCWAAARGRAGWQAAPASCRAAAVPAQPVTVRRGCASRAAAGLRLWLCCNGRVALALQGRISVEEGLSWKYRVIQARQSHSSDAGEWKHFFPLRAVPGARLALFCSWNSDTVRFNADVWGAAEVTWLFTCSLRCCREKPIMASLVCLLLTKPCSTPRSLSRHMGHTWVCQLEVHGGFLTKGEVEFI